MFDAFQNRADDKEAEFIQLYAKLAQTLAVSGVVGQNPSALLSIQIPGIVVPVGLDPQDPETEYYISNLLNIAVECNYVATPKAGLTSDVYKLILDGKELPLIELSPQEKEKLREAERYLFEGDRITPAYQAYIDYAEKFYAAQDTFFACEATHENGGPEVPAEVRERYRQAEGEWRSQGNKEQVETALATIRQLQGREPYAYWQALADRFAASTMRLPNGSQFQRVDSIPRYKEWFRDELWSPFSFDEKDYERQRRSGGPGMRGRCRCCADCGGSIGWTPDRGLGGLEAASDGAWRDESNILAVGPCAGLSAERGPLASVAAGQMKLKCSIKRITILRPWMDVSVFHSRLWKWSPQSIGRGIVISTGGSVAGNRIATGVLPVLPTTALLAKDVELITTSSDVAEWFRAGLSAGRRLRYGPFLVDDIRPPSSDEKKNAPAAAGVITGSPQLFGYISTIFDQCPNPDMTLPWPS
ncbi:hypothetical protein [Methylocystis heyeri]|uniref:Uncharacterized protein n=1 Tax=Methylocystis heyeri TaxID=391905 RepID=A0A6B8KFK6_9HYPH|nr:hypothetical protein [Methylocystis heyeri]QGM46389.1 hypothetical protein H2LOC_012175 [Methylocystis heyeri]